MYDKRSKWQSLLLYLGLPLILILSITAMSARQQVKKETLYSEIVTSFQQNQISKFTLDMSSGKLSYWKSGDDLTKAAPNKFTVASPVDFQRQVINTYVDEYNLKNAGDTSKQIQYNIVKGSGNWWISTIPLLVTVLGFGALMYFMFRRMNQSIGNETNRTLGFGKAKTKSLVNDENRKTTFADVAGADEEKAELQEIVEFLKEPQRFNELGARIPKGVLLVGPPGTGKTLLARAVAGEAGVPFLSISGSDFVEMYVGVGASRVRDLFEQAKKSSPAIIFIDEIDAVGRHRGAGMGGGHDEREQTLNQLLVEMDGFGANEGVIIIAATNRPDILDPALLRPGRFDRQVTVGYPDTRGREDILKVHSKGKPLAPDVDLSEIAKSTIGFTGADLENLLNEAALLAARRKKKAVTKSEIEEATIKVVVGTEKKSHKISDKEKRLTAFHEGGHALATYYLEGQDPVHQISIIPRGMAGGYTMSMPQEDRSYRSRQEMLDELVVLLGGRVAEALVLGDISTGASNDIQRATKIARSMVTKYGMSEKLGPISYGSEDEEVFVGRDYGHVRDYSEEIASMIDEEVNELVKTAYQRTEDILKAHMDQLELVAQALIAQEKLDGVQFKSIMETGVFEATREEPVPQEETAEAAEKEAEAAEEVDSKKEESPSNPEKTEIAPADESQENS